MRTLARSLLFASVAACSAQKSAVVEGTRPGSGAESLTFIEDDYPRALAEARSRKVPLFVEAWAPW